MCRNILVESPPASCFTMLGTLLFGNSIDVSKKVSTVGRKKKPFPLAATHVHQCVKSILTEWNSPLILPILPSKQDWYIVFDTTKKYSLIMTGQGSSWKKNSCHSPSLLTPAVNAVHAVNMNL